MKIIKEFIAFRKARNDISLSGIEREEDILTYMVNRYDMDKEKEINDLIAFKLLKDLIKQDVSRDYFIGWRDAMDFRLQLMRNNKKFIKETK